MRWEEYKDGKFAISENERLIDEIFDLGEDRDTEIRISYLIPLYPKAWRGGATPEQKEMLNESIARRDALKNILSDYEGELWVDDAEELEGGALKITLRGDLQDCRESLLAMQKDDRVRQLMAPLKDQSVSPA